MNSTYTHNSIRITRYTVFYWYIHIRYFPSKKSKLIKVVAARRILLYCCDLHIYVDVSILNGGFKYNTFFF